MQNITEVSCKLILGQKRCRLPVDPFNLNHNFNIIIDSTANYSQLTNTTLRKLKNQLGIDDAVVIKQNDDYIILYNDEAPLLRQRFTIAHELGHIYLEHSTQSDKHELDANVFAKELLVPRCLLKYLWDKNLLTVNNVSETFMVSLLMAQRAVGDFCPKFDFGNAEKELYKKYLVLFDVEEQYIISY